MAALPEGAGARVGPELANLIHRDDPGVLRDLADPSATINPDAVGYVLTLKDGTALTGTRLGGSVYELQRGQIGGTVAKVKKSDIAKT